jgi:hypothetical protein
MSIFYTSGVIIMIDAYTIIGYALMSLRISNYVNLTPIDIY